MRLFLALATIVSALVSTASAASFVDKCDGNTKFGSQIVSRSGCEFLQEVMTGAKPVCEEEGIPYQVVVAQAMVETGWGKHKLCGHNVLGIKSNGNCRTRSYATGEEGASGRYTINSKFCCFDTLRDCLVAWKDLVTGGPKDYYKSTNTMTRRFQRSVEFSCSPPRFLTYLFMSYYASGNRYVDSGVKVMNTIYEITGDPDFAPSIVNPDGQLAGQLPNLKKCHKSNSSSWLKIRECRDNAADSWPKCSGTGASDASVVDESAPVNPDAGLETCKHYPDLVCRAGKSSCDNLGGYHALNCPGDTWCCKELPPKPAVEEIETPEENLNNNSANEVGEQTSSIIEAAGKALSELGKKVEPWWKRFTGN